MKRILLVEDTPDKANDIKSFLKSTYGDEIEVTDSEAFKTAQQEILAHHHDYDMILLDMTMSTFDPKKEENGGTPEPVGGKQLLNYMYLNEITTKVLVVTMYKDFIGQNILSLDRELKEEYSVKETGVTDVPPVQPNCNNVSHMTDLLLLLLSF